jgi:hypothetical protein
MSPVGPELVAAALALNSPFGAYRATVRRLSWKWFLAIHLPIPFIFVLRISAHYTYSFIPWLAVGAIAGQLSGAIVWRRFRRRRATITAAAQAADTAFLGAAQPVRVERRSASLD